jgi:hypothetical protein
VLIVSLIFNTFDTIVGKKDIDLKTILTFGQYMAHSFKIILEDTVTG